tara:strand:+ start:2962 stop:3141 length:180 start_codon:yes stop_codon:yes gene_type:complete
MATLAQPMKATLWTSTRTLRATTTTTVIATTAIAATLLPLLTRTADTEVLHLALMSASK